MQHKEPTELDRQYSHACMLLGDQLLKFLGSADVSNILGKVNECEKIRLAQLELSNQGAIGIVGPGYK